MAKFLINNNLCLLVSSRRSFAMAADKVTKAQLEMRKIVTEPSDTTSDEKKNNDIVFWMRDPKTGDWKPETHFDDIDVADQRLKMNLPKK